MIQHYIVPHISINQAQFLAFTKIRAIKAYLHNFVITGAVLYLTKLKREEGVVMTNRSPAFA